MTEKFDVPPVSNERRKRQSLVLITPAAAQANWNGLRLRGHLLDQLVRDHLGSRCHFGSSIDTDSDTVTLSLTSPMVRLTSTRARSWV
ncbi:MAG: hypothetical protein M9913_20700 [Bryobacteraceae bacterium]|nr:hypothetical protein [Bryobacteraceae bacterium]